MSQQNFAAFIGIDWAEERHIVRLREVGSEKVEPFELVNKPELIRDWINDLRKRFAGRPIAIALEQFRGAFPTKFELAAGIRYQDGMRFSDKVADACSCKKSQTGSVAQVLS